MSSKKKKSLSEKVNEILEAEVPKTFESDDEAEETRAKVVEYDDEIDDIEDFKNEFNSSSIRKRNANLLEEVDKRYTAKKVSKKEIFNEDESSENNDDDDDDDGGEEIEESDEENFESQSENEGEEVFNDSDDSNEQNNESDEEISENDETKSNGDVSSQEEDDNDEEDSNNDLDDSVDRSNPLRRDRDSKNGIKTMSATNIREEIDKGNCIREQLQLWEHFLEMRIKMQKCLVNSNKLPQYNVYKNYTSDKDFKKNCKIVTTKLGGLLNNLLDLQDKLLNNFPETKGILTKSKKRKADENNSEKEYNDSMDEEIPSDTEDEIDDNVVKNKSKTKGDIDEEISSDIEDQANSNEEDNEEEEGSNESDSDEKAPAKKRIKLSEFETAIAKNHKAYTEYRNSVIQKWNDKTRIASGAISKGANQPAIKQIEFALANKDKLRMKTQLKRSEYNIIGKSTNSLDDSDGRRLQEYDTEIYDDDDFYHQLLRELIEHKSADITDPIQLSKQWIQLQNMRSKMKRKIDTRATKGRRLRYDVHQKLVNFMAPITVHDTWTDHAKDELYSSLFGKIKSVNASKKS